MMSLMGTLIRMAPNDFTPESYDEYLTAQMLLAHGGEASMATVVSRKRVHDGQPIGKRHANPLMDACLNEVECQDGSTEAVSANLIAENLCCPKLTTKGGATLCCGRLLIIVQIAMHCQRTTVLWLAVRVNGIHALQRQVGNRKWNGEMVQLHGFH
jgi:hypothetical protein